MASHKIPGVAIAMVRPKCDNTPDGVGEEKQVWDRVIKCYGAMSPTGSSPVTPETRIAIASNTKLFTVYAVLSLLSSVGKDINSRLVDLLPDLKLYDERALEACTVGDIFAHVTGLPGYNWTSKPGMSFEDLINVLRHVRPAAHFGQVHQYNNVMYNLLGLLIERLSGMPYCQYIKTAILEPLGMERVGFEPDENTTDAHWMDNNGERPGVQRALHGGASTSWTSAPCGGVFVNAKDMLKWLEFFPNHPHFRIAGSPRTAVPGFGDVNNYPYSDSMVTYGAGLYQCTYRGNVVQEAWGQLTGMRVQVVHVADYKTGWAVMTNADNGDDVATLLKMVLLDKLSGGDGIGPEIWFEK
ncbi:hypothetical protein IAT38_007025 [Cryptococcus sp. DSM 104549]